MRHLHRLPPHEVPPTNNRVPWSPIHQPSATAPNNCRKQPLASLKSIPSDNSPSTTRLFSLQSVSLAHTSTPPGAEVLRLFTAADERHAEGCKRSHVPRHATGSLIFKAERGAGTSPGSPTTYKTPTPDTSCRRCRHAGCAPLLLYPLLPLLFIPESHLTAIRCRRNPQLSLCGASFARAQPLFDQNAVANVTRGVEAVCA